MGRKSYSYTDQIKTPSELGMSGRGTLSTLAKDIGGLIAYTQLLVQGGGKASKIRGPLGDKFFLKTGSNCKDVDTGRRVVRSILINNIPDGSIPFISSGVGVRFSSFRGLVPGLMSNISKIKIDALLSAFSTGGTPKCKAVTVKTRDVNNKSSIQTAFLTITDIKAIHEGFGNNFSIEKSMPKYINSEYSDIISYVYYITILCLVIYIVYRIKN